MDKPDQSVLLIVAVAMGLAFIPAVHPVEHTESKTPPRILRMPPQEQAVLLRILTWVEPATRTCQQHETQMAERVRDAHGSWLLRNPILHDLLRLVGEEQLDPEDDLLRQHFEALSERTATIFETKRTDDPEDFTRECRRFVQELSHGT